MTWTRAYLQSRNAQAKAEGLCLHCHKRIAIAQYCGYCLEARAENQTRRRARWISEGKCSRCGKRCDREDRRMCAKCREHQRNANRKVQVAA